MKKLILILALFSAFFSKAQNLDSTYVTAKILAVHDGDSYKALIGKDTIWVRLAVVDCPEVYSKYVCGSQAYGKEIGDLVRLELKGNEVKLKFLSVDMYKRPVVRLNLNGADYSTSLVQRGLAWVVESEDIEKAEYKILMSYRKMAQKNKIGLFAGSERSILPSTFRKRNKCK